MSALQLTILGATGSIGASTLDIVNQHREHLQVFAVTANTNVQGMRDICLHHRPQVAVMRCQQAAAQLRVQLQAAGCEVEVFSGDDAIAQVSAAPEVDMVMAAIVGAAGLIPTLAAVQAGKRVLLANKEALVMSGQLFMDAVTQHGAQLLPVDSEHNAIFQCLTSHAQGEIGQVNLSAEGIHKIVLTGSGGPFLDTPLAQLATQTPAAACKHPNWSMGQKISVDSATMANKGLEYIEARWLFNCQQTQLEVLIHPQSVIHSMVQYTDGSVLAQLGQPDMRTPIAHTLFYPQRQSSGVEPLDFTRIQALTFVAPDHQRFPCLRLAQQACWQGQAATTAFNAANEVAVAAFLQQRIEFGGIAQLCDQALQQCELPALRSISDVIAFDAEIRQQVQGLVEAMQ